MVFVGIGEKSGRNEKDFSKIQGVKPLQMGNATVIMKKQSGGFSTKERNSI